MGNVFNIINSTLVTLSGLSLILLNVKAIKLGPRYKIMKKILYIISGILVVLGSLGIILN